MKFAVIAISFLFSLNSLAQVTWKDRLMFSTGGSAYILQKEDISSVAPALNLHSKFNVLDKFNDFSVSINLPISMGAHFKNEAINETFFVADYPITAEINVGHGSSKNFHSAFGFFAGAGYTWQQFGSKKQRGGFFTGGLRTWAGPISIGLRYAYIMSNDFEAYTAHRIGIEIMLGKWVKKVRQMNGISKFVKPMR